MPIKTSRNVLHFEKAFHIIFCHKYSCIQSNSKNSYSHFKENPDIENIQNEGYSRLFLWEGSLTVEAAFGAVLFFITIFSLLCLFWNLEEVHRVQLCLSSAAKEYACFGTRLQTGKSLLQDNILLRWDENEEVCYSERTRTIPFLGNAFFHLLFYQQMKVSDYSGQSMVPQTERQERYVYLAENGTVYHLSRQCVYLNPQIERISYAEAEGRRNRSGEKYRNCERCCAKAVEGMVYITLYGNRMHANRECSGIRRTVRRVQLSELGDMPPCSKCSLQ